ncbi:MAG: hypothetical protein M1608_00590 [Candidatus Omnitrophica bacterium]|nr:hypothetical protein [Candidatus Omnitrophota bacterium]
MCKVEILVLALAGLSGMVIGRATPFADQVVAYQPGTGYTKEYGTDLGYTNAAAALGQPSRQTVDPTPVFGGTFPVDPFSPPYLRDQLVSLGEGGSLTVQFNTPIYNDPIHPYGLDFIIFGSAGFLITNGDYTGGGVTDGSLLGNLNGASRVSVSEDNITYYSLNPAFAPAVDGNYPTDGNGDFTMPVNPALGQSDFSGSNLAAIRALYAGSAGGAGYDLAWAQDAQGNSVDLSRIQYARVDVLTGHAEIDGFAAVAAVPEPSVTLLGLVGTALFWPWLGLRSAARNKAVAH